MMCFLHSLPSFDLEPSPSMYYSLVVIDFVFLVAGLPSIVSARLGFQDRVFGDLTSMLFFIVRGWLHGLLILFCLFFFALFSHIVAPFIADHVSCGSSFRHIFPLQVWIVFFSVYALYAWKVVCGLKIKLWFPGGWLLLSPTQVVYLLLMHPLSFVVLRWHERLL
ncbi:hypothetical protein HID58_087606 [Brassica napus]|uniref:Transmembrane protein n=1 Tax=Brassica napus TaxID=3708 RepID=A0ABQ7XTS0_BRANA|nr:hypothetical protein HID58_087606 [Brassica napus]